MRDVTTPPFWQRWSVQTLASLAAAVAVSAVTHWLKLTTTLAGSFLIVVGSWTIMMIFYIAYSLHSLQLDHLRARPVRDGIDAGDALLLELQSRLQLVASRTLNGRPNRVFIDYCHRSLKMALEIATSAAQSGELTVRDHHFDTVDTVMGAFEGCEDRTFRCVWLLQHGDLFDDSWRQYMRHLVELARKRRKNEKVQVRILFVAEDVNDAAILERPATRTVLGFLSHARGFDCRLISGANYHRYLHDTALSGQCLDFGVYGDHLLFRTTHYDPVNQGTFSIDPTAIQKYRRVHDLAMNSTHSRSLPTNLPSDISLDAFLHCDTGGAVADLPPSFGVER